ncbi:MerR family transcriptional regulator [Geminocystis sp. NIES-3709]|uniref:MerR family transcriptional regulator n=1 Tax=Geminocystis sp. NIES-3709 TaxID=1617448 RepID=UPI0005FC393F|nr:MerR family transcriptional regulator [Geminocystis sp. NIES-3709]BAQ66606.1 hypothetical protein GM3709_3371 [Geminocystis sp. NIES-3709]
MDLETIKNKNKKWSIDEFVEVANRLLPLYLPDIRGNTKVTEEINIRLVRSYTSQKLMDEPIRQNRYAFYTYRHLLQLLLVKRLLSDGIGTTAINDLLTSKTNEELKGLLIGGIQIHITTAHPSLTQTSQKFSSNSTIPTNQDSSSNSALDFLADLKGKRSQSPSTLTGETKRNKFNSSNPNKNTMSASSDDDNEGMSALNEGFDQDSNVSRSSQVSSMGDKEENWTRLRVLDGLELHIRDDFIYPNSIKERESLIQLFGNIFSKRC